jgi:hypothetical protein
MKGRILKRQVKLFSEGGVGAICLLQGWLGSSAAVNVGGTSLVFFKLGQPLF